MGWSRDPCLFACVEMINPRAIQSRDALDEASRQPARADAYPNPAPAFAGVAADRSPADPGYRTIYRDRPPTVGARPRGASRRLGSLIGVPGARAQRQSLTLASNDRPIMVDAG